jgi:hypothetical protein
LPILNLRVRGWYPSSTELDALHHAIIEDVNRDGQRWISSAVVNGRVVIRTMIISYLSEQCHIEGLQRTLLAAVSKSAVNSMAA